jgi:hypothetical protein
MLLICFLCALQDYTGDQVTTKNFFAVLLGNKTAVTVGFPPHVGCEEIA